MKTIELSICGNYVADWAIVKGLLELAQNVIDEGGDIQYHPDTEEIYFNTNVHLPLDTLMLGATTKKDSKTTIGEKGEGYKLAALVLLREKAGLHVLRKDHENWVFVMEKSDLFGADVLKVQLHNDLQPPPSEWETQFIASGIDEETWNSFTSFVLQLRDHETLGIYGGGSILKDMAGFVFVGGLFVLSDPSLEYGYNLAAGSVSLDRDRVTIPTWELYHACSLLHSKLSNRKTLEKLIAKEAPDVSQLHYHKNETVNKSMKKVATDIIVANNNAVPVPYDSKIQEYSHTMEGAFVPANKCITDSVYVEAHSELVETPVEPCKFIQVREEDLKNVQRLLALIEDESVNLSLENSIPEAVVLVDKMLAC